MPKRIVSLFLVLMLLLGMSSICFAATTELKIGSIVYKTDSRIADEIVKAQLKAVKVIASLSGDAQTAAINDIITTLQTNTYNQVTKVIDRASAAGILIERTWIPVLIGNQTVYVDPARCVRY